MESDNKLPYIAWLKWIDINLILGELNKKFQEFIVKADTEGALIYFILYFDQDIVEHNRAEKSKMMNEKDQQNIIIDRFGPLMLIW